MQGVLGFVAGGALALLFAQYAHVESSTLPANLFRVQAEGTGWFVAVENDSRCRYIVGKNGITPLLTRNGIPDCGTTP